MSQNQPDQAVRLSAQIPDKKPCMILQNWCAPAQQDAGQDKPLHLWL